MHARHGVTRGWCNALNGADDGRQRQERNREGLVTGEDLAQLLNSS
jgi:hypothetical protein